jgi:hypothetical protein
LRLYRMPRSEREQYGDNGRVYFENNFESHRLTTELIARFQSILGGRQRMNRESER